MAAEDRVLVSRTLISKTASVLRQALQEKNEAMEKVAEKDKAHSRFVDNMHRLYKLAAKDLVPYESIPDYLEKLAEMDENAQELELLALEKAANHQLLDLGDISNKPDSTGYGDPISDLVMGSIGL